MAEATVGEPQSSWASLRMAAESLKRPYRVTIPMVVFVLLVPAYIFIADVARFGKASAPAIALDRAIPLQPVWALIYGALYLFLILLPVFVVREDEHLRRTVWAYLSVWITAYVCFLVYPTMAPRGDTVVGDGFGVWGLRFLYGADPPYNCFPSLHVAHSFVSALTCYRVHREVGIVAIVSASLVAVSTLFTKQHYVADVVAGVLLALVAYGVFIHGLPRERTPELDRRLAPVFALVLMGVSGAGVLGAWVVYALSRSF
jgi:membrane-associated phospholipid phosphatase